jgi:uncharacterized repeat protein (TIGR03803 family)
MIRHDRWRIMGAIFVIFAATAIVAPAQIFTSLASFNGSGGGNPQQGLVQGTDGNYYGTTYYYGSYGYGVVFEVTPTGTLTTLHSFAGYPTDGGYPVAELLLATDGSFYGTTEWGGAYRNDLCDAGCGTVFKITPGGQLTTLHSFCSFEPGCVDGAEPFAALVQATDGSFYGTTGVKGHSFTGTVFKITSAGKLTNLYSFCGEQTAPGCADGAEPFAAVVQGTDGNFYGATYQGGKSDSVCDYTCGAVFKITPSGTLTTLYRFCVQTNCTDGANPVGSLIQALDGSFYGTTAYGGSSSCGISGCGTIFKITREGRFTTLHSFAGYPAEGSAPYAGLVQATDGNFYGTTLTGGANDVGAVFEITTRGVMTTLYSFCTKFGCADGSLPEGLLQATDGKLYGTTFHGGNLACEYGCGTVFSLNVGLGPFVSFVHNAGKVGQTGGILGQGFTGTSSVSLNGTPASYTVVSDTFIRAAVPPGATTGFVTVTTPSGTLTSNVPFHVIK